MLLVIFAVFLCIIIAVVLPMVLLRKLDEESVEEEKVKNYESSRPQD